jgi:hypothetical protein
VVASVHPIRTDDKLDEFFSFMFGDTQGFVYSPTLHPISKDFEQYFFAWPSEKEELINHVRRFSPTHEIYYSPALYSRREATKDAFLGTWLVWAEFDGILPESLQGVPEPSIKIQSSDEFHQHWYWKLNYFVSDIRAAEQISKRITYYLKADLAIWNANRVLRPPNTIHHESSRQTSVIRWDERRYGIEDFSGIPDVELALLGEDDNIGEVPEALDVIFKYPFSEEDARFFKQKEVKPGHETGSGKGRSAALARLGHICAEMGMSTAESLSLLLHADNRWGKYSQRRDQRHRLLGIINYARAKHPVDPVQAELESPLRVYTYQDFMSQPKEIDWVIEGFVHRKGLLVTFGPAGVGKSQLLLRACEAMSTGRNFLKWPVVKPMKMLYISLEMPEEELYTFLNTMKMTDDPLLRTNFMVMPLGLSIKMGSKMAMDHLNRVVEKFQPDGIIIDSFLKAVGDDIDKSLVVFNVMDYVDTYLRLKYGCFVWFIHHPRKGQPNNKRPDKLDDMYGSLYLGASATNVFTLWHGSSGLLKLNCLKLRMAGEWEPFSVRRTPNLDFEIVENVGRINKNNNIWGENPTDSLGGSI